MKRRSSSSRIGGRRDFLHGHDALNEPIRRLPLLDKPFPAQTLESLPDSQRSALAPCRGGLSRFGMTLRVFGTVGFDDSDASPPLPPAHGKQAGGGAQPGPRLNAADDEDDTDDFDEEDFDDDFDDDFEEELEDEYDLAEFEDVTEEDLQESDDDLSIGGDFVDEDEEPAEPAAPEEEGAEAKEEEAPPAKGKKKPAKKPVDDDEDDDDLDDDE